MVAEDDVNKVGGAEGAQGGASCIGSSCAGKSGRSCLPKSLLVCFRAVAALLVLPCAWGVRLGNPGACLLLTHSARR